jgi:hypothetical protein
MFDDRNMIHLAGHIPRRSEDQLDHFHNASYVRPHAATCGVAGL